MVFDDNKPIYLQIYDNVCERILKGELNEEDKIPSVREYGAEIGVNPNTIARAYEKLTEAGVIYTKRGMGYFVTSDAGRIILENERKLFIEVELPAFIRKADLLEINLEAVLK